MALGRSAEALKIHGQLKKDYPHDYTIDLDLGRFYDSRGDLMRAGEYFKRAVEEHPLPDTFYDYAVFLEKAGDLKEAVGWLKRYLETAQDADTSRKNRAQEMLAQWEKRL